MKKEMDLICFSNWGKMQLQALLDPGSQTSLWNACSVSWLSSVLAECPCGMVPISGWQLKESIFFPIDLWQSWSWSGWQGRERWNPSYLNCLGRGERVVPAEKWGKQKTPPSLLGRLTWGSWRSNRPQVSSLKPCHSPGCVTLPHTPADTFTVMIPICPWTQVALVMPSVPCFGNFKTFKTVPKIPDLMYFEISFFFLKPLVMQLKKKGIKNDGTPSVLVCLGCRSKVPGAGWLTQKKFIFNIYFQKLITGQENRSPRSRCPQGSLSWGFSPWLAGDRLCPVSSCGLPSVCVWISSSKDTLLD